MSARFAPPRRSLNTSSTRFATSALVDFMFADLGVEPCCMPIVQAGVVDHGQVLKVPVRPQVGRTLEGQAQPIGECHRANLRMAAGGGDDLAALLYQLLDRPEVDLRAGLR